MITRLQNPYEPVHIKSILHPLVNRWFSGKFKEFSLPQLYGVMEIHCRKNILISAPTGSGKTLTAFLSVINELVDSAEKQVLEDKVYCLYVSPLKALGNDIQINLLKPLKELEELAEKKLGIRVAVRTGDTTAAEKAKMLKHTPHILITTPESLAILLNSPKFKEKIKDTQWLIVDEIHSLAENKRGVHLSLSMERLQKISPGMARIGLSATIAPLEEIAKFLVGYSGTESQTDNKPHSKINGEISSNNSEGERDCGIVDVSFIKKMDLKVLSPVRSLVDTEHLLMHQKMYELIDELVQQHRTTLIFTNTRSATERVVHNLKEMFPQHYSDSIDSGGEGSTIAVHSNSAMRSNSAVHSNIAAHHGSLSKQNRFNTEQALRDGKLKVVVSSTSLELGIDIGYVDLVLCLGSPKSVARFLQRSGRSGHKLQDTVKARIIVMDRDDLVECSILLKSAIEKKIDQVHIPINALDVLAQQIYGIVINEIINIYALYHLIKKSYSYHTLSWEDFFSVIKYLSGEYVGLEERHIYARIWYDKETGDIGKRGKMARIIYMTNIGTIPEESYVTVKIGEQIVGKIDEAFLEHLKPGDVFVLGGEVYMFKFSRGMTAQVSASVNRPPTVPSWFSEMLPLSYDLAMGINRFRKLMEEKLRSQEQNKLKGNNQDKETEEQIIKFINDYLYVDENAAYSIYRYFYEQYHFSKIPSDRKIVVETYADRGRTYVVFHTLYGRRVNDCLSRALAYVIGRSQHRDVEMGITDNGFYLSAEKSFNAARALDILKGEDFRAILETAIEKSEVLSRRFRHCATRSLMILRQYMGHKKNTGRMQVGSKILFNAVKRIDNNFSILKEARREVMEDLMDCQHAQEVISQLNSGMIEIIEKQDEIPSPFAFSLISEGYSDVIRIEDKQEFLRRIHQQVLAKIALKEGKKILKEKEEILSKQFSYADFWEDLSKKKENDRDLFNEKLKLQVWTLKHLPIYAKEELVKLIEFGSMRKDFFEECKKDQERIEQEWPKELKEFVLGKINSG